MPRILISHRGNIDGPNPERENTEEYLLEAVAAGYYVEVDVWYIDGKWFLGHDEPEHETTFLFMTNYHFFLHCKNQEALLYLNETQMDITYFWHQEDDVALTSNRWLWTYPGKQLMERGAIAVCPEMVDDEWDISNAEGVCSDFIGRYK